MKFRSITILLYSLVLCVSCKKFVQIPNAKNQITGPAVFTDSADATAAVLGMYITIMNATNISTPLNGQITQYAGMSSDELAPTDLSSSDLQFYQNALDRNSNSFTFWQNGYSLIYQANACIEGLTASTGLDSSVKHQLLGEAKLMRALNYFHLVNLYGPVPLVTGTDYNISEHLPRVSEDSIYSQIIADLTDAQNLMTVTYVTGSKARPNKYAALALLSKVYLYQQQWDKAEAAATQIISSGAYSMVTDLNTVFLANSEEAIWQLRPVIDGYSTPEGNTFVAVGNYSPPQYIITDLLLHSFEENDQRRVSWVDSVVVDNQLYYFPYKYKSGYTGNSSPDENYMVFRLGELYLIRAEARAQQAGKLADAVADLNVIRGRAGLAGSAFPDASAALTAIQHERQIELFCEWGNRWYDLKRTGTANTLMPAICQVKGGTWNPNWLLYPVPLSEIQRNPLLVQNAGY